MKTLDTILTEDDILTIQIGNTEKVVERRFDDLFDFYAAEMPYGTAKARTGDPYEWITDRLDAEIGGL